LKRWNDAGDEAFGKLSGRKGDWSSHSERFLRSVNDIPIYDEACSLYTMSV